MLSLFPRDVLIEILDLIESVSEGFPTYSSITTLFITLTQSAKILVLSKIFFFLLSVG